MLANIQLFEFIIRKPKVEIRLSIIKYKMKIRVY